VEWVGTGKGRRWRARERVEWVDTGKGGKEVESKGAKGANELTYLRSTMFVYVQTTRCDWRGMYIPWVVREGCGCVRVVRGGCKNLTVC
jgi:hypothetical protein